MNPQGMNTGVPAAPAFTVHMYPMYAENAMYAKKAENAMYAEKAKKAVI